LAFSTNVISLPTHGLSLSSLWATLECVTTTVRRNQNELWNDRCITEWFTQVFNVTRTISVEHSGIYVQCSKLWGSFWKGVLIWPKSSCVTKCST
jgi:hypothetical protein